MAATKINSNFEKFEKMPILNRLDNYCYLVILCVDVETQNSDVNQSSVEADILAVYYGMSVERSQKVYTTFGLQRLVDILLRSSVQ